MKRFLLILLFLFVPFGILPAVSTMSAKEEVKIKPIKFEEYDLENGLHVILHADESAPVVSTYLLYHVGSKNERADRTGFAHFFEHLMFEGTQNIDRGEIDKLVSGAGGNLNASTSFDSTQYYLNLPANQLKTALWIESERMMHAQVEGVAVETQREVVKEERRMRYENRPFGTVFLEIASMVFAGTPYQWTPIGAAQYIDQATLDEFRDFYRQYYVPNNATLAVAGDFEVAEAKKWIKEYFAPIPRGEEIQRPAINWPPENLPEVREKTVNSGNTPLPATIHVWPGPKQTDEDTYALELLAMILGKGESSRLHRSLVVDQQAAYSVSPYPVFLEMAGAFGIFVIGNRGEEINHLDELVNREIERVRKDGVTPRELQKAINQKTAEIASSLSRMRDRAELLADYHVFYGDASRVNNEIERYRKVTTNEIRAAAEKYLDPNRLFVLHYPTPDAQPSTKPAQAAADRKPSASEESPAQVNAAQ